MDGDAALLTGRAMPLVSAAVAAFGQAVLSNTSGEDGTVAGTGCQLLVAVFGSRANNESVPAPLAALAADPSDEDALAAVRATVRQTLAADPIAAGEVRALLAAAPSAAQTIYAGRDVYVAGRDITVNYMSVDGASIPVAAAVRDARLVFSAADVARFTGREWLLTDIDRFIASSSCGYVLVEADAGMGKTALSAWLVKERGYVSHFSRSSGGRTVRAALANLSAQLIARFELDNLAPGGMLPEWVREPSGFELVLSQAADRARRSRTPLVLVVDGLDEAEQHGDGLPFGLPPLLPDGVHAICTYRTGTPLAAPGVPVLQVRISKDDPRNISDIRAFLAAAAHGELAGRLAESGTSPADFIKPLVGRCEGVWVYLKYVLEEIELGLRSADSIGDLPTGLRGYYASQMRRWENDPGWEDRLLPLLATLGVAGEPLSAATLAALAGDLDIRAVRRLCDQLFRPLLTITRDDLRAPVRYEVYHASFRQVLKADHAEPASSTRGVPYDLQALGSQLGYATLQAHSRIADFYLDRFGGLARGLPALAEAPQAAAVDDGYPLRHLARHLHHAGRVGDLHLLLAASHVKGETGAVNVWFAAHDAAECVSSYLDDLARAQRITAAATDEALARRRLAPSLGLEIRYALMTASLRSRAARIFPELLDLLLRTGHWTPERALDHTRRLNDPASRLDALRVIHPYATPQTQPAIMAEAVDTAAAIGGDDGAEALARLAPHLSPGQLARALRAATAISDRWARARALANLAPCLSRRQLTRALDAAFAIREPGARVKALAWLAPHLSPDQLTRALRAAAAFRDDDYRAKALAELAPHLPPDKLARALARALDAAAAASDNDIRAEALAALAPHLPPDQVPRALDAATASDDDIRAEALAALAPHLPPDQVPRALDAATSVYDGYRGRALAGLAPRLSPGQLARALDAATAISDDDYRAKALAELAPHLPPDELARALTRALDAAAAISHDDTRAEALAQVAPHLPPDQQPVILARALDAAAATSLYDDRAKALAWLAPHLPPDQVSRALDAAIAISDDDYRAWALAAIAPYLPSDQQPVILTRALDAAAAISADYLRAEALAGLAPHLSPDQVARALDAATAISGDYARAEALAGLALHLSPDQVARALDAATAISGDYARAEALAGLAPHLSPDQVARALNAIAVSEPYARIKALAGLVPHLPPDQQLVILAGALDAATAIREDNFRARGLAGLAPYLSPDQLAWALDAATAIGYHDTRAETLADLAPHLSPGQLAWALDAATAIRHNYPRARALAGLAPHLSPDQLARALNAVPEDTGTLLAILAKGESFLPSDAGIVTGLIRGGVRRSDRPTCLSVIAGAASSLNKVGGTQAMSECANAILDTARWWQ